MLTFGFRATDGDGDFVDTTIAVNVDDDMPIVTGTLPAGTLTVDETTLDLDATLNFAGAFSTLFGADGPGAGTIIESNKIDLYLLQDLSGSFGDDETNVSGAIADLITRMAARRRSLPDGHATGRRQLRRQADRSVRWRGRLRVPERAESHDQLCRRAGCGERLQRRRRQRPAGIAARGAAVRRAECRGARIPS